MDKVEEFSINADSDQKEVKLVDNKNKENVKEK